MREVAFNFHGLSPDWLRRVARFKEHTGNADEPNVWRVAIRVNPPRENISRPAPHHAYVKRTRARVARYRRGVKRGRQPHIHRLHPCQSGAWPGLPFRGWGGGLAL